LPAIGVDGCRGGWVACGAEDGIAVFERLEDLVCHYPSHCFYIDVPVGLPDDRPRLLDAKARKLLPGRSSSIFPVPGRAAVYASDYQTACRVNYASHGRKLTLQTWHICPKIREADQLLIQSDALRSRMFESHPEIAFAQLSGDMLQYGKKTPEGIEERQGLLGSYMTNVRDVYQRALETHPRKVLARDDILDAMVLSLVGSVRQMRITDGVDESGIALQMVLPASSKACD
jgi:predicted RNase H-like nuclease